MSKDFLVKMQPLFIIILTILFLWAILPIFTSQTHNVSIDSNVSQDLFVDPETSESIRVNLVDLALPYLVSTDARSLCISLGGIWHNEADWVGCEGIGSLDCTQPLILSAEQQCNSVGAEWTCSLNNLYCKYI